MITYHILDCTPNQKLVSSVLYLKIMNTFWKINISLSKLSKELQYGIVILEGQVVFKLCQNSHLFWSTTAWPT